MNNSQDSFRKDGTPYPHMMARPYVWRYDGGDTGLFANSQFPDRTVGDVNGHGFTAPAVADVEGDGTLEILFAGESYINEGYGGYTFGNIKAVRPQGNFAITVFETVFDTPVETKKGQPWYTGPNDPNTKTSFLDAAFTSPPIVMPVDPDAPMGARYILASAATGLVYAWKYDRDDPAHIGQTVPGFPAQTVTVPNATGNPIRASLYDPIAVADLDGVRGADGKRHYEIVAASGNGMNYTNYEAYPENRYDDGVIHCWRDDGTLKWRYPASGVQHPYDSGVALGRLRGPSTLPCVVAVDSDGKVVALDGATGTEVWSYDLEPIPTGDPIDPWTKTTHRHYRGALAQPLILDVNNDNFQDVIVGTAGGYIFVLNGKPGLSDQERLLWKEHVYRSADSLWWPDPMRAEYIRESQYEEIEGLAVGPLDPNHSGHAMLLVTTGRANVQWPEPVGGHALLFDLSVVLNQAVTWKENAADWPQFQQNAQRTGLYREP